MAMAGVKFKSRKRKRPSNLRKKDADTAKDNLHLQNPQNPKQDAQEDARDDAHEDVDEVVARLREDQAFRGRRR